MRNDKIKYKIPEICEIIYKRRRDLVDDLLDVIRHKELLDIPNLDVNKDIKGNLINNLKDTVIFKLLAIVHNLQMLVHDLEDINIIEMVNNSTLAHYMGEGFNRNYKLRFFVDTDKEVQDMTPVIELVLDDPEKDISDNNKYKYLKTFSMTVDENYYPKETVVNNTYMGRKKKNKMSEVLTRVLSTEDSGITESIIMYIFLTNLYKIIIENTGVDLVNKLFKEMRLYAFDINTYTSKYQFKNKLDGNILGDLLHFFTASSGNSEERTIDLDDLDIEYEEDSISIKGMKCHDYGNVSRELLFYIPIPYSDDDDEAAFKVYSEYKGEVVKREDLIITDSVLDLMANVLIYYKLIMNE